MDPLLETIQMQSSLGRNASAAVGHLLSQASQLPCSTAAQAFTQLVQPTARFQLALDALLPILDPACPSAVEDRILVSFILYALYAPHPITINPFKSVLFAAFVKEKKRAVDKEENIEEDNGEQQLSWVLWKILKGDGSDIAPYSPRTLARSPLPSKLKAPNLELDEILYTEDYYPYSSPTPPEPAESPPPQRTVITAEQDLQNERIATAMKLLLAARERVLSIAECRLITPTLPALASSNMITPLDLSPVISNNPTLSHPLFVALLTSTKHEATVFLDILPFLPPTLSTFDLMGRLLRDSTPLARDGPARTVADLVRGEALGRFVQESIAWLEQAERMESNDDSWEKGIANLCRFYHSLIKLGIVDPAVDADTAEMAHFSLQHARFEEANAVYRALALGRFEEERRGG
ncbi:hypothetical protein C8J56DRAFT_938641 [Mycena floridula]|nr:hypothetical protein C8J56DRAFT_938641 [Mycena floridula]